VGYIFEQFTMTNSYQSLYLTGTPSGNQNLNVLEGFYNNYTANVFEALVQYKF
jgi:hypothetical protein